VGRHLFSDEEIRRVYGQAELMTMDGVKKPRIESVRAFAARRPCVHCAVKPCRWHRGVERGSRPRGGAY
jgi:hypothetical protein